VQSFAGGVLTIALSDGATISGAVTESTDIRCPAAKGSQGEDESKGDDGEEGTESKGDDGDEATESKVDDGEEGTEPKGDDGEEGGGGKGKAGRTADVPTAPRSVDGAQEERDDGAPTEACTTAALTPGAVIAGAELTLSSEGPAWTRIELGS